MNIFMLLFLVQLACQCSAPPLMDSDRLTGSLIGRGAEPLMHVERRVKTHEHKGQPAFLFLSFKKSLSDKVALL